MNLSALGILSIVCGLAASLPAWSCDYRDKNLIYETKFTVADPAWPLPEEEAKPGSDGLTVEPNLSTIDQILYIGDFFDKAAICASVVLERSSEDSGGGL